MKTKYKGFEIEAKREDNYSGEERVWLTVTRISDGATLGTDDYPEDYTVKDVIEEGKVMVNDYYEDPDSYGLDDEEIECEDEYDEDEDCEDEEEEEEEEEEVNFFQPQKSEAKLEQLLGRSDRMTAGGEKIKFESSITVIVTPELPGKETIPDPLRLLEKLKKANGKK